MNPFKSYLILSILFFQWSNSQFIVGGEIRPRYEFRQGFGNPFPVGEKPLGFISQRTRVHLNYSNETNKLAFFVNLQNTRIWGDVPQLNQKDAQGLNFHEAWILLKINQAYSFRIGRQELVYDNSRIMGNVGWAQQARSHDAIVFMFKRNLFQFDIGIAHNNDASGTVKRPQKVNTYKALQYVWLHNRGKHLKWSLLFLNNGLQNKTPNASNALKVFYSQTIGGNLQFNQNKLSLNLEMYYQGGKDAFENTMDASFIGVEGGYALKKNIELTAGFQNLSGNDNERILNKKNRAFAPFYGTNHKFNGLMDYFYVGNHTNSVGLSDFNIGLVVSSKSDAGYLLKAHYFSAPAKIDQNSKTPLGYELDFVYKRKWSPTVNFSMGYSRFFSAEGIKNLRNINSKNNNHWLWLMLTAKPNFFKSKT